MAIAREATFIMSLTNKGACVFMCLPKHPTIGKS
ncbi:uncharacterized protein G2W53_012574 [Senna tora]|uniref:Uncharacterized protein n=1 Tax=Senna tora TaxID=362788 RepID=A0A834WRW0_9FABA|nr:uncharacterized protein G2W53_012574 [Senna tora]